MSDLTSLIEKLEKAEGPDRELDCQIAFATGHFDTKLHYGLEGSWIERGSKRDDEWVDVHVRNKGTLIYSERYPAYTSSIDAAAALRNRVLPGWDYGIEDFCEDGAHARVWEHGWHDDTVVRADHVSPAIALVLATLRALQSRGEA